MVHSYVRVGSWDIVVTRKMCSEKNVEMKFVPENVLRSVTKTTKSGSGVGLTRWIGSVKTR